MNTLYRAALGALFGFSVFASFESEAKALGPVDVEVGGRVGVATNPTDGPNPFGLGVGARGGVSVFHVYGGLSAMKYFGSSDSVLGVDVSTSTTLLGVEAGYSITALPLLTLRPQIGIGNAHFSAEAGGISGSNDHLYLEPGLTVIVPLGLLFVGADANALLIPGVDQVGGDSETYAAFSLHAQVGLHF